MLFVLIMFVRLLLILETTSQSIDMLMLNIFFFFFFFFKQNKLGNIFGSLLIFILTELADIRIVKQNNFLCIDK